MKVAVITKFNKLAYQEEKSHEDMMEGTRNLLKAIENEKKSGQLLEVYGMPGEDSTMWIYEVETLDDIEELFMTEMDRYCTYELHYLTDLELNLRKKLEKGVV